MNRRAFLQAFAGTSVACFSVARKSWAAFPVPLPATPDRYGLELDDVKAWRTPESVEGVRAWDDPAYNYRVIAIVDKAVRSARAPTGQTISIFEFDEASRRWRYRSDMAWDVSTGTETRRRDGGLSTTRTGFYRAERLAENYVARSGEAMPYSVFYDERFGTAIHATAPHKYPRLGGRASIGCTRLRREHAIAFYELIQRYGRGPIVEFEERTNRPNFWEEDVRVNRFRDGSWNETVLGRSPRTTPRVIEGWRAMVVNVDSSSSNPDDVTLDPRDFQRDPQRLFEFFPRLRV